MSFDIWHRPKFPKLVPANSSTAVNTETRGFVSFGYYRYGTSPRTGSLFDDIVFFHLFSALVEYLLLCSRISFVRRAIDWLCVGLK